MQKVRSMIRNNEGAVISDFLSLTSDFHINHCDALGSPRKMTNESGAVSWTGAYYPFGEMITGSGNVHGFTGKELDSETGLNYFCQRYYDSQIGRFMTLDKWTNLPGDESFFGYNKYLSWDNYQLKYGIDSSRQFTKNYIQYRRQKLALNVLLSISPVEITSFVDNMPKIYFICPIRGPNEPIYIFRKHNINGYVYCDNNPLKYTDPEGKFLPELIFHLLIEPWIKAAFEEFVREMSQGPYPYPMGGPTTPRAK